ncbi:MAG: hypothetical protein ACLQVI_04020 [Polyangiaceae bacterium]
MLSPARRDASPPAPGSLDVDALTVAMAVAPGVYSRNRFFELFKAPELRRARSRASVVRGIVQHLSMLQRDGEDVASTFVFERRAGRVGFRYMVPSLRFERRTELSELEASCVFYLAERAGVPGLAPTGAERDMLHGALLRLAGGAGGEVALLLR